MRIGNDQGLGTNGKWISGIVRHLLPQLLTHDVLLWRRLFLFQQNNTPASLQPLIINSDEEGQNPEEKIALIRGWRTEAFIQGVNAVTQTLWRPFFLSLLIYDLYRYLKFPLERYQMTPLDLAFGIPKNYQYQHASLSVNLGSDIPMQLSYWPWILIPSAALSLGLYHLLKGKADHYQDLVTAVESVTDGDRFWLDKMGYDAICALPFLSGFSKQLALAEFDVQFKTQDLKSAQGLELSPLEIIIITATKRSFLVKWQATSSLGRIYYSVDSKLIKSEIKQTLEKIAQKDLRTDPIAAIYAHYQLWSIGQSKKIGMHLLAYLFLIPVQIFAQIRLWSLFINKMLGIIEFIQSKNACDQNNKIFHYVAIRGNYECTVCDEDFVDFKSSLQGQGCLDGLLAMGRDPQFVLGKLRAWQNNGPYTTLDFSKQPWTEWSLADWQSINEVLQLKPYNQSKILNLSRIDSGLVPVRPELLAVTAGLLKAAQIEVIDLTNQLINQSSIQALLPGLIDNKHIRAMNFTGANMGDDTARNLLPILPTMPELFTLRIARNQLTGNFVTFLNDTLRNTSLTTLDVSSNQLVTEDLEQLSAITASSALQTLDISNHDFTMVNMAQFGSNMAKSELIELAMSETQMSDDMASHLFPYLANASLQILYWSGNQLTYDAMSVIVNFLPLSRLTQIYLDDNYLDDNAINLLSSALNYRLLMTLSLSGNRFTAQGFMALVNRLANSALQELRVARNALKDNAIQALTASGVNSTFLQTLDFSNCGLTGLGVNALLYYSSNRSITSMDVSRNVLLDLDSKALQTALNGSQLQYLSLRGSQIPSSAVIHAISILADSRLQYLDISDTSLGDEVAVPLAAELITTLSEPNRLGDSRQDIDFNREISRARPRTALKQLVFSDAQVTNIGLNAFTLVLPSSGMNSQDLILTNNLMNTSAMITSSHSGESCQWLNLSGFFMLVCAFLFLLKPAKAMSFRLSSTGLFTKKSISPEKMSANNIRNVL